MIKPPPSVTSDLAQRADAELCDLARVVRPDWDIDALRGALMAAGSNPDWSVALTLTKVTAMLTDDSSQPFELLDAVRRPVRAHQRPAQAGPGFVPAATAKAGGAEGRGRGADLAKSVLAGALIRIDRHNAERERAEQAERQRQLEAIRAEIAGIDGVPGDDR